MSILDVKDRIPTNVLSNKAVRYGVYDESGNLLRYEYMKREDEPIEEGTPVNKALFENIEVKSIGYNVLNNPEIGLDKIENDYSQIAVAEKVFNNTTTSQTSCVTLDNGNVFVAYQNTAAGAFMILSPAGEIIKTATQFNNGSTIRVSCAKFNNGNVLIAYSDGGNNYYGTFIIVSPDGTIIKGKTVFTTQEADSTIFTLALSNGNVFIAYSEYTTSGKAVILNEQGEIVKSDIEINNAFTAFTYCVELDNGNIFVTYRDNGNEGYGTLVILNQEGEIVVPKTVFNNGTTNKMSCVKLDNGNVFIAYSDEGNSYYGTFVIVSPQGEIVKDETIFASANAGQISCVKVENGNIVIVYNKESSMGVITVLNQNGDVVMSTYKFNDANTYYISCTKLDNGNVFIAYRDDGNSNYGTFTVRGTGNSYFYKKNYIIDGIGTPLRGQTLKAWDISSGVKAVFDNVIVDGPASTPLKDGNMFFAYTDYGGEKFGRFMILKPDGSTVVPKTVFHNQYVTNKSCVTLDDGNIFLAYSDTNPYQGVFMVLSPNGEVVIPKTVFNNSSTANTDSVSCTKLNNGNVLIAYSDGGNSYSGTFVIVSPDGTIVKEKTVFNSGSTTYISCATFNDGKAMIAFMDGANSNYGKFVITDENGTITTSETTFFSNTASQISCTPLKNGNMFMSWKRASYEAYCGVRTSTGSHVREGSINSKPVGTVDCATLKDGRVFVAYRDNGNDGVNFGKYVIYDEIGREKVVEETVFETHDLTYINTSVFENGDIFIGYRDLTNPAGIYQNIVTDLIGKSFVKNTLNDIEIDTLLQGRFYELLYDGKFIAKEVRV